MNFIFFHFFLSNLGLSFYLHKFTMATRGKDIAKMAQEKFFAVINRGVQLGMVNEKDYDGEKI